MFMLHWPAPLLSIALLSATVSAASAGQFNEVLDIGDEAPAWTDLPGTDGKRHSLADLKDKPVIVVVFTCNSCPYAVDYEDRIIVLAKRHGGSDGKAAVVAINVNTIPGDRLPEMKKRADEKKFNFPYLFDETQQIAKAYGANFTPEFFVLDKGRRVVYMGAMDDSADPAKVKVNHVEQAIEAALAGKTPTTAETIGIGCRIRYERQRRKRD